eukprot:maker-scaffold282_size228295-snap-gene-0.16 protein:Tk05520 transcript:maker-scaffold282_size228295-snap-gene-0.16-mRNA-1 annotation:"hypothetical protein DAPPUDRAFT_243998"
MQTALGLVGLIWFSQVHGQSIEEELLYDFFPEGFKWGAATSAYQVEGGWDADGKGPSIWDTFVHQGGHVFQNQTGDVACDSYHKYAEDVQLIKNLGLTDYRFSISWSRVLPNGTGQPNPAGIDYYNRLIDELLAHDIQPAVTLYHWDLPQALEDRGGWLNPEVADWFEEYARLCFQEFGDRVKFWITLNEPRETATNGYEYGGNAPGIADPGIPCYVAGHHQIRAHARAYRLYYRDFPSQNGQVGISLNIHHGQPKTESAEDIEAVSRWSDFFFGWFAHPIFQSGNYPQIMIDRIAERSSAQGFSESRLPEFTTEEMDMVRNSSDFMGINYYTTAIVQDKAFDIEEVSNVADTGVETTDDSTWYRTASGWLFVEPTGIRKMMNTVRRDFGDIPIYILENGMSDYQGNLDDLTRIYYFKHYLNQLLKATKLDGINVRGYFAWSLLDNFEWGLGYSLHFGMHRVDFDDSKRPRTPKASARFLKQIVAQNGFVANTVVPPRLKDWEAFPFNAHKAVQLALNDVARTITGKSRQDHVQIADLFHLAGSPSFNELAVRASVMETWKAFRRLDGKNGGRNPLGQIIFPSPPDAGVGPTTARSQSAGIVMPPCARMRT